MLKKIKKTISQINQIENLHKKDMETITYEQKQSINNKIVNLAVLSNYCLQYKQYLQKTDSKKENLLNKLKIKFKLTFTFTFFKVLLLSGIFSSIFMTTIFSISANVHKVEINKNIAIYYEENNVHDFDNYLNKKYNDYLNNYPQDNNKYINQTYLNKNFVNSLNTIEGFNPIDINFNQHLENELYKNLNIQRNIHYLLNITICLILFLICKILFTHSIIYLFNYKKWKKTFNELSEEAENAKLKQNSYHTYYLETYNNISNTLQTPYSSFLSLKDIYYQTFDNNNQNLVKILIDNELPENFHFQQNPFHNKWNSLDFTEISKNINKQLDKLSIT